MPVRQMPEGFSAEAVEGIQPLAGGTDEKLPADILKSRSAAGIAEYYKVCGILKALRAFRAAQNYI